MRKFIYILLAIILYIAYYVYNQNKLANYDHKTYAEEWINLYKNLQTALITVKNNDTIIIPAGHFHLNRSLLMDGKSNVVIKGGGMHKTIISFKNQEEGSEGIKISHCKDIQLIGFTMEDAKGDIIKVTDTDGILFRDVKVHWTNGPHEKNGAYGFYPVLCKRVIIEDCYAACASDAGVYVGQSDSVIIRRNNVYNNVAGIESENSKNVAIYDNFTHDNTGGILVFDLPGLTQYGHTTLVRNNKVINNNHKNFAPKGNIVGMVPQGTGIMLLATRNISIVNNEIKDNRTSSLATISYDLVEAMNKTEVKEDSKTSGKPINHQYKLDSLYDPYPNHIFISQNNISNKYKIPTLFSDFGLLFLTKFTFNTPSVIIDGFSDKKLTKYEYCYEGESISFANLDIPNNFSNISKDISKYKCKGKIIEEVKFNVPRS